MSWNFSIGWFTLGLLVFIAGGAIVVFHRQISENLASGVSSYSRVKLFGLITISVGLATMLNIHTLFLNLIIDLVFKR